MTPTPDPRTPSPAPATPRPPSERDVDEMVQESFPASDPPSTTPLHAGPPDPASAPAPPSSPPPAPKR